MTFDLEGTPFRVQIDVGTNKDWDELPELEEEQFEPYITRQWCPSVAPGQEAEHMMVFRLIIMAEDWADANDKAVTLAAEYAEQEVNARVTSLFEL